MTDADPGTPKRRLSSLYVAVIGVAMVVGAGIFKSPALVAENAGSADWFFLVWVAGGLISLLGALCYAELSTAFPHAGGDYHFLRTAYGRRIAFLFAWSRFAVINTGSIALLGFVLGDYLNFVWPLGPQGPALYAASSIMLLTLFNLRGVHGSAGANFSLTGLEALGLILLGVAAVWLIVAGTPPLDPGPARGDPPTTLGLALVFVLLAYGGWSEISTLLAETRDPRLGMVRGLLLAIGAITVLYLIANWALWRGLGLDGLAASSAPAADLMQVAFGPTAGGVLAIGVATATITSINATIVVGARTTYAAARDWPAIARLAQWEAERGAPVRAILAQSAVALALVGLGAATRQGFATLVDFTAPIFWLFLTGSGLAVIVLRVRRPAAPRVFRTPLYPLTPLLFAASSAFVLWSSLAYVGVGGLVALLVLLLGGGVLLWMEAGWVEKRQGLEVPPPRRNPWAYAQASPYLRADRVTAMLLITADQDFVPMSQAERMFAALARLGQRARLVTYWGEEHLLWSPANIGDLSRLDAERRIWRETQADRFTGLDRRLVAGADDRSWVEAGWGKRDAWSTLTRGRLLHLEALGLASRSGQGFFISSDLRAQLTSLQLGKDIQRTLAMHRMRSGATAGLAKPGRLTGSIVERGSHDELGSAPWVIVRDRSGTDHYCRLRSGCEVPGAGRTAAVTVRDTGAGSLLQQRHRGASL